MKTKNLSKKLMLKKKTVAHLDNLEMITLMGGDTRSIIECVATYVGGGGTTCIPCDCA